MRRQLSPLFYQKCAAPVINTDKNEGEPENGLQIKHEKKPVEENSWPARSCIKRRETMAGNTRPKEQGVIDFSITPLETHSN